MSNLHLLFKLPNDKILILNSTAQRSCDVAIYPSKPKSSLFILIPFFFLSACGDGEPSIKEIETVLSQEFQNDTQQGANEQPSNKISVLERKCRKGNVAYICQLKIQQGNFVDNAELRFAKNNGKWIRVPE